MARIFQISVSPGGVPKNGMHTAVVNGNGITVDDHADKKHHGGPLQNLCVFRLETILALQEEGHPIFPGSTGENITTVGLPVEALQPGKRLKLGDEVLIEVTHDAAPCTTIADSFFEGNFNRISAKKHPGWNRFYAKVVQGGTIRTGDKITEMKVEHEKPEV